MDSDGAKAKGRSPVRLLSVLVWVTKRWPQLGAPVGAKASRHPLTESPDRARPNRLERAGDTGGQDNYVDCSVIRIRS